MNGHLYYHQIKCFLNLTLRFLTACKKDTKDGKDSWVRTLTDEEKCKNRF